MEDLNEIVQEFVIESRESLSQIESDLLSIEASGAEIDNDLVNKVFRAIHSVKGTAGFIGLRVIGQLAHSTENVLSLIRNKTLVPTTGVIGVLLGATDQLCQLINSVDESNEQDVTENVRKLDRIVAGEIPTGEQPVSPQAFEESAAVEAEQVIAEVVAAKPQMIAATGTSFVWNIDRQLIEDEKVAGKVVMEFQINFHEDREFNLDPENFQTRLMDTGVILDNTAPDQQTAQSPDTPAEKLIGQYLVSTVLTAEQFGIFWNGNGRIIQEYQGTTATKPMPLVIVEAKPKFNAAINTEINVEAKKAEVYPSETPLAPVKKAVFVPTVKEEPIVEHEPDVQEAPRSEHVHEQSQEHQKDDHPKAATGNRPNIDANIRVSVKVLDQLMNLAGELVLGRNQLLQTIANKDWRAVEAAGARLDQVTSDLQETIMQTRMQPIANVFSKFTRIVRDLSSTLGKECDLIIEGKEVELDKTIIEAIGDPLTHLIRNAVDHGIERPDVRLSKGKKGTGRILLRAYHQDGKVNISIADDGNGIDPVRLKKKAVEKGILTPEKAQAMTDREAINLIFHAGFSTADQVSAVSGRGVGMDVVKTNFEKLGGSVEIDTKIGAGTTFTVHLPLTLAIMPSLIVCSGAERYAVPQVNIAELVRVRAEEYQTMIQTVKNVEVLKLRGNILPLVRLTDVISPQIENEEQQQRATHVIVVESGHHKYGLIVDSLMDSEEIVVKPLGQHMKQCKCLAGATILGDGQVALILDVGGIANHVSLKSLSDIDENDEMNTSKAKDEEKLPILLIRNHPQEQFGVMMQIVARIERIRTDQIDTVAGQEILQYRGGTLPLLSLDKTINAKPRKETDRLYVVVFHANKREVGLVAPEIFDIATITTDIDSTTFQEPGVLGSLVINNVTTRLLDPYEIARKVHPEWFIERRSKNEEDGKLRVLLAEDSPFFRKKISQFLTSEGFEVTACEDGAIALDTINKSKKPFDLVVTDVEMPNMSGLMLTQKLRETPAFSNLPIIAVTSLADEENVQNGLRAGVTRYLVKLDRENLIQNIFEVISKTNKKLISRL